MTTTFHIHNRIEELRREIVEISAMRNTKHCSGSEKVKHDQRLQRLGEIRSELLALHARTGTHGSFEISTAHLTFQPHLWP